MESCRVHRTRRLATVAGIVALLLLVPAAGSSAASATRQVQILDDCDPATFNAAIGSGTCVKDGTTTFSEFIAQLLAQGRAPAWRFAPSQLRLDAGGTLQAHNRGGEDHTFTEVANFGGGCIQALNDLLGLTPVPECAGFPGGAFAATLGGRRRPSVEDRDRGARVPRSSPLAQRTRSTTSSQRPFVASISCRARSRVSRAHAACAWSTGMSIAPGDARRTQG